MTDLQKRVYALHLTTEQNEEVEDIIETYYSLGWENGYDQAGRNYQPIILKLMSSVVGETNDFSSNKTMKRISAAEAKALCETYKEKITSTDLEKGLDYFYEKIYESTVSGETSVSIPLKPFLSPYKDSIIKILKDDGYKVKYFMNESYHDVDEYIRISW